MKILLIFMTYCTRKIVRYIKTESIIWYSEKIHGSLDCYIENVNNFFLLN